MPFYGVYRTHCNLLSRILGCINIENQVHNCFMTFLHSAIHRKDRYVNRCVKLADEYLANIYSFDILKECSKSWLFRLSPISTTDVVMSVRKEQEQFGANGKMNF